MRKSLAVAIVIGVVLGSTVMAQTPPPAPPSGQKSLSATMNIYVFPSSGQEPAQQSKDEGECYNWAVQNTGTDPFELAKKTEQQKQQAEQAKKQAEQATQGAGAKGAVGGAAAGALIGEIASDDAGKGAAYGAAAGMIAGRRKAKLGRAQAGQEAEAEKKQADQTMAVETDKFKKAFSVCLEAKKYMVKY